MSRKQIKKNEGPTCACGRGDLYEEWLKENKTEKDETKDSNSEEQESLDSPVNSIENKK